MMLSDYKALIFDWDGTLVDSHDWVLAAHNHVRTAMNLALWTKNDIFGSASFSTRELYPRIYGNEAPQAIKMLTEYTDKNNYKSSTPYTPSEGLLSFLKSKNILMGVVSNKRHEPLNLAIGYLGWNNFFLSAVGAGRAERDKPDPAPLIMSMKEIDPALSVQDVLYVGDSETDLLTAKNAGCDVAFVQSEGPRPDLIEKYAPTYAFDSLEALWDAICQAA